MGLVVRCRTDHRDVDVGMSKDSKREDRVLIRAGLIGRATASTVTRYEWVVLEEK